MKKKITEEKKLRTPEEINQQYSQLCALIGDYHVKKESLDRAIAGVMEMVNQLNTELEATLKAAK